MIVGASCTAELIQDDPGGLAKALALRLPRHSARSAGLSEERKLGRGGNILSARARYTGSQAPAPARRAQRAAGERARCNILGPDIAGLPQSRRRDGNPAPSGRSGDRSECGGAAGCAPVRSGAAAGSRLQHRALSGSGAERRQLAEADLRAAVHQDHSDRCGRDTGLREGSVRPGRRRQHGISFARAVAVAMVLAQHRQHLSHRQARLHFRRCHACDRRGQGRHERIGVQGCRAWHLFA